ncbi:GNAT family N-acetyltransferase [Levilactobacillus brevis]|uniref:GNAT family N-acetyltransferase n=1 Tax=Levilactobacillus brevis TaxID=1580 RepID=UPI002165E487|nr:GNAT family protein [Levilactobacillus brevis]UVW18286.1 GNAT family N-acetyltransferase [Levilactobacillus brevis]
MENLHLTDHLALVAPISPLAADLYALIAADRVNLSRWLPWANTMHEVADEAAFLAYAQGQIAAHQLWLAIITVNGKPAGMIDLHDKKDGHADVGYWLGRPYRGHGYISQSLQALEKLAFNDWQLNKLQILTVPDNIASQAVAKSNHYHCDARLPKHIPTLAGDYQDAIIFSKLRQDWLTQI